MQHCSKRSESLVRELSKRHLQSLALAGTFGSGVLLRLDGVLELTGPSMRFGWSAAVIVAFLTAWFFAEMRVESSISSSLSHITTLCRRKSHFLSGCNCCVLYILARMPELTAVGSFTQFSSPGTRTWAAAAIIFLMISGMNVVSLPVCGETEFWFSMAQIAAVGGMIVLGLLMLVSGKGGSEATVGNLFQARRPFLGPNEKTINVKGWKRSSSACCSPRPFKSRCIGPRLVAGGLRGLLYQP